MFSYTGTIVYAGNSIILVSDFKREIGWDRKLNMDIFWVNICCPIVIFALDGCILFDNRNCCGVDGNIF